MAQTMSSAAQLHIKELLRKTREKEEERKRRRREKQTREGMEHQQGDEWDQVAANMSKKKTPSQDKMVQATSSSWPSGSLEIEQESEPTPVSQSTKEQENVPESATVGQGLQPTKTIETQRSLSTAQQGGDTSQKTLTVQSRSGWMVTLEWVSGCDESRKKGKSDDKSRERQYEVSAIDENKNQEDSSNETTDEEEPLIDF